MKIERSIRYHNYGYHVTLALDWSAEGLSEVEERVFAGGNHVTLDLGGKFEEEVPPVEFYLKNEQRSFPFKSPIKRVFKEEDDCSLEMANLRAIVFSKHMQARLANARDRLVAEHSRQNRNLVDDSKYDRY